MKKIFFLILFCTVPFTYGKGPTLRQRWVGIFKHSMYGCISCSAAGGMMHLLHLDRVYKNLPFLQKVNVHSELTTSLYDAGLSAQDAFRLSHSCYNIGKSETTTQVLAGSVALLGVLTLYHAYKVIDNTFGILEGPPEND